jgi:hypothetical protein
VKRYLGSTTNDRDPQGVTSAQPPAPLKKETPDRKEEVLKKLGQQPWPIPRDKVSSVRH